MPLGKRFGQERPPLSVTIKGILERYPDGQIFKELIQNADDAGANTVWFYVDERQHQSFNLPHPDLANFLGPALVAANDACFTDQDWEGIQRLQRSIKADDPFKVGRFGIGFNSVYHITDVPVLVSRNEVAFLDPQEKLWQGDSGRQFNLSELFNSSILASIEGLADFHESQGSCYPHTIIRLPLRTEPSDLSENVYNTEKMQQLLSALKKEAKYLLLFLKSVSKIVVINVSKNGKHTCSFQVAIDSTSLPMVNRERCKLLDQLHSAHKKYACQVRECINIVASFDVVITDQKHESRSQWLVTTSVGTEDDEVLSAADKLHIFPWVGTALELTSNTDSGRIFCFLPLPSEVVSNLPVHVNGTFSLNDERRTLKWVSLERGNDKMAQWNQLLLTKLLPNCYLRLLMLAKERLSADQYYRAWPDPQKLSSTNWEGLLYPFYQSLFQTACLWSSAARQWITFRKATFVDRGEQIIDVVVRVLTACKLVIVFIPDIVWEALELCSNRSSIRVVTPSLARREMRVNKLSYVNEHAPEKLELLRFCLSDHDGNYADLHGLALVPLATGKFTSFVSIKLQSSQATTICYVCSEKFPQTILPNISSRLVDVLDPSLHGTLIKVAKTELTQLKLLDEHKVAHLLPKCFPDDWCGKNTVTLPCSSFPSDWFARFWKWVQRYNVNLSLFQGLLVLPLAIQDTKRGFQVTKLMPASKSKVILISDNSSSEQLSALTKMHVDCTALKYVGYINHPQIYHYVNRIDNPSGVLTAFANANLIPDSIQTINFENEEAAQLQQLLSFDRISFLDVCHRQVLQNLSIFWILNDDSLLSINKAKAISWNNEPVLEPFGFTISPAKLPDCLVVFSRSSNHLCLFEHFETDLSKPRSMVDFVQIKIFPMIKKKKILPDFKVNGIMQEVLELLPVLKKQQIYTGISIKAYISTLPFLLVDQYTRKAPVDLYDPTVKQLRNLFNGEAVFPEPPFGKEEKYLHSLRECGLRTIVGADELVTILETVSARRSSAPTVVSQVAFSRAEAVIDYLLSNPNLPSEIVSYSGYRQRFKQVFKLIANSCNCLPVLSSPPDEYPKALSWKGSSCSNHLVSTSANVVVCEQRNLSSLSSIVGSQMYFVVVPSLLSNSMHVSIPLDKVLTHFQLVIKSVDSIDKKTITKVAHLVYKHLEDNIEQLQKGRYSFDLYREKWIWLEKRNKFLKPGETVLEEHDTFNFNLEPFIYQLPDELHQYQLLFTEYGMQMRLTSSQAISVLEMIKEDKTENVTPQKSWTLVKDVLQWLTNDGQDQVSKMLSDSDILYVPVDSNSSRPQLVNVAHVVYTDLGYLKSFHSSRDKSLQFIHKNVRHLAQALGVKGLSEQLNISLDAFGDVGPHESLVTRIKNVLRDYKDGLTIIKELLQNADDAGASEVNICYDTRSHTTDRSTLLYPGMAQCHGPALIVHNNAKFSNEDFDNITKLAGATKQHQRLKIGKFGLGFCSLYHITDTPSFVSGDWLYIFDPTVGYLQGEIEDKARPGKKLRIVEELVVHSHQLDPYIGLYGFELNKSYKGTLFRFPFRTTHSSCKLSSIQYDSTLVQQLMKDIEAAGSKLLIFLRHLKRITFSHIDQKDNKIKLILSIQKKCESTIISKERSSESLKCAEVLSVNIANHQHDSSSCQQEKWLLATYSDIFSTNQSSEIGTSTVACPIVPASSVDTNIVPCETDGEMFCFLPLSLRTGLPVHVSSNFAVLNNRTGIHSHDPSGLSRSSEGLWNFKLMQNVIPKAYHMLLLAIKQICEAGGISTDDYNFTSLWPLRSSLMMSNPWENMIQPLYELIADTPLFYSHNLHKWLPMKETKFLSPNILCSSQTQTTPECVTKIIQSLDYPLVHLGKPYKKDLPHNHVRLCCIEEQKFFQIFFSRIQMLTVSVDVRNEVLFLMLVVFAESESTNSGSKEHLKDFLTNHKCIPCTPNGQELKFCSEIIAPKVLPAQLYNRDDGMFPIEMFSNDIVQVAMGKLGMIGENLPWKMLIERAQTITSLYCQNKLNALNRVKILLHCLDNNVSKRSHLSLFGTSHPGLPDEARILTSIAFLPVMDRPKRYPSTFKWSGDGHTLMSCVQVLRGESNARLAGSQSTIVCEASPKHGGCGPISYSVVRAIGIRSEPSCDMVIEHLCYIAHAFTKLVSEDQQVQDMKKWLNEACSDIYKFLESQLSKNVIKVVDLQKLIRQQCLWTGQEFIAPFSVAVKWYLNGPYLFKVPSMLENKQNLINALKIQEKFEITKLLAALEELHVKFQDVEIGPREMKLAVAVVSELDEALSETIDVKQVVYLPDTNCIMRDTNMLAYNDAAWCKIESECYFTHHKIPRPAALKLRVKPVQAKALETYETLEQHFEGVEFGQHEELTQRLKNILSEYPFDITVLKELLQNADDAKAKKMYVILDKRTHGTNKLPSTQWKDLQGPALLVWNDSNFSKKDLKGIQKLGLGSKRSQSDAIGQYGIGFNVVYHLTDCPSFITNGDTMCVLDPHLRYIPGANELKPGRMYENLGDNFWTNWSDLKAPYLREELQNCPQEIRETGSLFRFPLRYTTDLVRKSKLLDDFSDDRWLHDGSEILSATKMETYLNEWAPKMKDALIFLNNVTELSFFVIDAHGKMLVTYQYEVSLDTDAMSKRLQIQQHAARFPGKLNHSSSVYYPLVLSERTPRQENREWIVQRGVGDCMKHDQHWEYLKQIKPNHGLATPISKMDFKGKVFCFLPLSMESTLPVHVNGNFILDAARSGLWKSRDVNDKDDRSKWNFRMIEAIASSYAQFVVTCQASHISTPQYSDKKKMMEDIQNYYRLFPYSRVVTSNQPHNTSEEPEATPEGVMKQLADNTYKKLFVLNPKVHLIIQKEESEDSHKHSHKKLSRRTSSSIYSYEWLPLINEEQPSQQVYFWKPDSDKSKAVAPVLKTIGIVLSAAPIWIRKHFREVGHELPEATPATVFQYYCKFYNRVTHTRPGAFPCRIDDTSFGSVENFKLFIDYILRTKAGSEGQLEFPNSPMGFPLLVTADQNIRCFSKEEPVINLSQDYTTLFQSSLDKIVHPLLNQFKCCKSYFLQPSEGNWHTIHDILSVTIPESLHNTQVVLDYSKHFERDKLQLLWKCLDSEPVFKKHLKEVLQEWALIVSTNSQVFACKLTDQLLPVIPPKKPCETSDFYHNKKNEDVQEFEIFELLSKHGMPVLDDKICNIVTCQKYCPQFCHHEDILKNMFFLHKEVGLKTLWTQFVQDTNTKLLKYLARIHFRQEETSLTRVKSLPIFCDITSNYRSLEGEVFIWPDTVCMIGSSKWLFHTSNITVFLNKDGPWKILSTAEVLGIKDISSLTVYTHYIFPHFDLLTQNERIEQLKHIRETNELFNTAYNDSRSEENIHQHRQDSIRFIAALEQLPCIPVGNALKRLCDFCDPQVQYFQMFPETFHFPPTELSTDEWLIFFRKIGLRTKPTKSEFVSSCHRIASGQHQEIVGASKHLLECLCYDANWHEDTVFLKQVSEIPFVLAHKLPRLSWIKPVCPASNVVKKRKKSFDLTTLKGSVVASIKNSKTVWTVKSVVEFPSLRLRYEKEYIEAFLCKVGVSPTPTCDDVVQNLCNIAQTKFAKYELFEQYPESLQAPKRGFPLGDVVKEHFLFIKEQDIPTVDKLRNIACIPISQDGNVAEIVKPVLVKPISVVATHPLNLKGVLPILNPLPNSLFSVLSGMLENLGVSHSVQLEQVLYALETIHQNIQVPFDPNTIKMIEILLKHLFVLLPSASDTSTFNMKCPLYLPNTSGCLVVSKSLLFDDIGYHRVGHFDLTSLPYSFMSLLVKREEERDKYDFSSKELFNKLPENVRPFGLSMCCIRQLHEDCRINPEISANEFASSLKKRFNSDHFSNFVMMILQSEGNQTEACTSFTHFVEQFVHKLKIFTVNSLRIDILLTLANPPTKIGTANVDFHLQQTSDDFCLYIDSSANPLKLNLMENLAKTIVDTITDMGFSGQDTLREPDKVISTVLRAEPHQLQDLLHDRGFKSSELNLEDSFEEEFHPKVGDPIPESWHHRLQSDINNYFRPQEMAGLEVAEEQYIYVRVEHIIPVEEKSGLDNDQETDDDTEIVTELAKYLVWLSYDDEETRVVSVIDLFKILRIKKVNLGDGSTEMILYNPESEAIKAWDSVKDDKLKDIMKNICAELQKISRLTDRDEKRKALKAMYLKWHPDKNPHPLASKAFQFLRRQIERLEQGLPLEDPSDDWKDDHGPSTHSDLFDWWDDIVQSRVTRLQRERTRPSSGMPDWTSNIYVYPEPSTAKLWLKQAEHDMTALHILLERVDSCSEVSSHVCFLACQVAEKALKAGMYHVRGLQPEGLIHHKFVGYAGALEQERRSLTPGLQTLSRSLENYYTKTRYPNVHSPPCVPSTKFGPTDARDAEKVATQILDIIIKIVH